MFNCEYVDGLVSKLEEELNYYFEHSYSFGAQDCQKKCLQLIEFLHIYTQGREEAQRDELKQRMKVVVFEK